MRLAVIPARGGSKRIPRKNIRPFLGQPVIGYSIAAAIETGLFERIIVSTDDEEIANAARQFGAETPFIRPADLADDHTGTNAVVRHAIQWLGDAGYQFDLVCCIYATAPFLQSSHLALGYQKLVIERDKAYAFSVTSYAFPIQRSLRLLPSGVVEAIWPENRATRSQDLEHAYHDAGQFYWGRSEAFLEDIPIFSSASLGIALPRHLVQDIDTEEDWVRAELMYRALQDSTTAIGTD
jgi:N-acylneuraminate cytidylyltransferase